MPDREVLSRLFGLRRCEKFKEVPGEFMFVTAKTSRDIDELQVFLEDSIAENTEGLIVKTMDATYETETVVDSFLFDICRSVLDESIYILGTYTIF